MGIMALDLDSDCLDSSLLNSFKKKIEKLIRTARHAQVALCSACSWSTYKTKRNTSRVTRLERNLKKEILPKDYSNNGPHSFYWTQTIEQFNSVDLCSAFDGVSWMLS